MSNEIDARDFGRLEADVANLEKKVDAMVLKVDEMHRALMQAQGGWRVMVLVGGAAAAVGAGVTKLIGVFGR